ncbi:helix-turn-helix transcriptional regulator [Pendulispora brunnea]|uniref:Helix-turn-helix transcriptional regulator n=1 Tax=Pendulispora brunnea TaxID=2905690 RepID=A0ABZ2K1V9_9BACT
MRAGQVQEWGNIAAINGPVVLFTPTALDAETRECIRHAGVVTPNHWSHEAIANAPAGNALDVAFAAAALADAPSGIRSAALMRALATTLLLLVMSMPTGNGLQGPAPHPAFVWFRDELEANFRTRHKVAEYAARLGYSTRTLNRLARHNTGLSAKQLIDERIVLEARRSLAHGRDSVAQIAEHLGFDDASNFAKYFQQRTGMSPSLFRNGTRDPRSLA